MNTWQEYNKDNRPMRYVRVKCMTCHGVGEADSWNGQCYKCEGKGYQYRREDEYLEDINSITQG